MPVFLLFFAFFLSSCAQTAPELLSAESSSSCGELCSPLPLQPVPSVEDRWIEKKLSTMSTEEKVGQLFFVRHPEQGGREDTAAYHLGGVLLFARDFKGKTREEVCEMTKDLQSAAAIPLLIGTDEEGGSVVRASSNPNLRSKKFAAPQILYQNGGYDALAADALEKSDFLRSLGVNVNFAPVCDLSASVDDYMYPRTLALPPEETALGISAIVGAMNEKKMGSVLKHFPGYGNNVDTHTGIAVDTRPLNGFFASDFVPFRAGIDAHAGSILMAHTIIACMDKSYPASLSAPVHELLRREFSFDGVILTDDLAMNALDAYAQNAAEAGSVAVLAVNAGNDMILTTDYATQIPAVIDAVKNGTISQAQIDASLTRIFKWKFDLGLIEVRA